MGQAPRSRRAETDDAVLAEIRVAHEVSRGTYGAPRVHAELAAKGIHVGRKRVARLMSQSGLAGVTRRRFVTTTVRVTAARRRTWSNGNSPRQRRIGCGWQILPTFRHGRGFCISRSCSMPAVVGSSAGQWLRHLPPNWCLAL